MNYPAVPVDPNLLLQSQMVSGPGGVPMGYAGPGQPLEVPPYTSTTKTQQSVNTTKVPETPKLSEAEAAREAAADLAEQAQAAKNQNELDRQKILADKALEDKKLAEERLAEQTRLRAEEDRKVSYAMALIDQRQKEMSNLKPTTYVEDMGVMRHALSAVGVALGAYASTLSGGPNTAFQIFQSYENAHRAKQQAQAEKAAAAVEAATGNLKLADEARRRTLAASDEKYLLRSQFLEKQIEAKIRQIPAAQASGEEAIAQLREKRAERKIELAKTLAGTRTVEGPKESTTTVEGKKQGNDPRPQRETVNEYVASKEQAQGLSEFESIVKRNPKAWKAYQTAVKESDQSDQLIEGGAGGLIRLGRGAGATDMGIDQRIESKVKDPKVVADAKKLNQLFPIIQTGQARILDPVGVLNEASQREARKSLNVYTMKPEEAISLSQRFRNQHEQRAELLTPPNAAAQSSHGARVAPGGQTPEQVKYTKRVDAENMGQPDYKAARRDMAAANELLKRKDLPARERRLLELARKNPKDPTAQAIIRKIVEDRQ